MTQISITDEIKQLLGQLKAANNLSETQPIEACQEFMQITVNVDEIAQQKGSKLQPEALQALQKIQNTASDNLVQAALMATPAADINDVLPLLENRMDRLNNLINLGFYLHVNKTTVQIQGEVVTAQSCALKAQAIAPENEMTLSLAAHTLEPSL